jgi:cytochrome c peroxidase
MFGVHHLSLTRMSKHESSSASRFTLRLAAIALILPMMLSLASCNKEAAAPPTSNQTPDNPNDKGKTPVDPSIAVPTSPGELGNIPSDNLMSDPLFAARVTLGSHLYYDGRISVGGDPQSTDPDKQVGVSCASCHSPAVGFSDPEASAVHPMSFGVKHFQGFRNAPGLTNVAYNKFLTWDGKFKTLEAHAPGPMFSAAEMGDVPATPEYYGAPNEDTLLLFKRLQKEPKYAEMFTAAFGDPNISLDRMCKAIASYERTFISTNSKFDSYNKALHNQGGDINAISDAAKRGFKAFIDPAVGNCASCHSGFNFTNNDFINNGLPANQNDLGLQFQSHSNQDINKFKVPTLRNVAQSGPYMHNGSKATLEDVVNFYRHVGHGSNADYSSNVDYRVKNITLTDQDVADIVEFLKTLTDNDFLAKASFQNPWK